MNGQHHQNRSGETCEWAALAALGVLTPQERDAYAEHLEGGCPVCEADLFSFEEVVGRLGMASEPVSPSALLKSRLMARISEGAASSASRGPESTEPRRVGRFVISNSSTAEGPKRFGAKNTFGWGRRLAAAAVFLMVCSGVWMAVQIRTAPHELDHAAQETYIDSLYARVVAIIRVGLGDHLHCTVFRKFTKDPPTFEQMAKKMGPDWVGLVPLVEERAPEQYRVMLAHRCGYRGREFVHLALQSDAKLLSVIITPKRAGEDFSTENLACTVEGTRGAVGQIDVEAPIAVVIEKAGALPVHVYERFGDRISAGDLVVEAGFPSDVAKRRERVVIRGVLVVRDPRGRTRGHPHNHAECKR